MYPLDLFYRQIWGILFFAVSDSAAKVMEDRLGGDMEPKTLYVLVGDEKSAWQYARERRLLMEDFVLASNPFAEVRIAQTRRRIVIVSCARPVGDVNVPSSQAIAAAARARNAENGFAATDVINA